MKLKIKFFKWLCFALLTLGIFTTTANGIAAEPIIIGVLHSEEYPYAKMMKNSFEMALDVVNKNGGIKGRPLKLIYANDQGKREPGETAVKALVNKSGAVLLVGAYQSTNAVYMARIADKLDTPLLVCTASDDRITERKWKNVYRLNPPAGEYAKGLEEFLLHQIKPKSMTIVYENSSYGTGGALRMMWFCRENEIDLRGIEPYHKERLRSEYFNHIVNRVKEDAADVIYMVSYLEDAAMLTKTLRKSKVNALLCGGAGGFTHKKFINMTGKSSNNLLTATLWTQQLQYPGTKAYYDQYVKMHTLPPDYHGAEAYSSLLVVADVLKRADSLQPQSIRTAMDKTDTVTPFGPVKFLAYKKYERQNRLPTQVLQIIDGKFECIWPETHATMNFKPPAEWRRSQ
jgi:branched-chain amino acid transport system substrate-binding protein